MNRLDKLENINIDKFFFNHLENINIFTSNYVNRNCKINTFKLSENDQKILKKIYYNELKYNGNTKRNSLNIAIETLLLSKSLKKDTLNLYEKIIGEELKQ